MSCENLAQKQAIVDKTDSISPSFVFLFLGMIAEHCDKMFMKATSPASVFPPHVFYRTDHLM